MKNKKVLIISTIIVLLIIISVVISVTIDNKNTKKEDVTEFYEIETSNKVLDKTPESLIGDGSEESPYLIQSIEDLVIISNGINNGKIEKGKIYSLETDLDFKSKDSYVNADKVDFLGLGDINGNEARETLMEELTKGKGFEPIGKNIHNVFSGEIRGNGHTISNLYIKDSKNYVGLIGVASTNDKNKEIKISNLKIKNAQIEGKSSGSIIGYSYQPSNITIDNCNTIDSNIKGGSAAGGIIGETYNSNIKINNCINNANITSVIGGGIIGIAPTDIKIQNCVNEGNIKGEFFAGGIIGDASNSTSIIKKCYNSGKITGNVVAGIMCGKKATIEDSFNKGVVEGNHIGAIVSNTNAENLDLTIERCYYLKGTAGRGIKGIDDILGKVAALENEEIDAKIQEIIN